MALMLVQTDRRATPRTKGGQHVLLDAAPFNLIKFTDVSEM